MVNVLGGFFLFDREDVTNADAGFEDGLEK